MTKGVSYNPDSITVPTNAKGELNDLMGNLAQINANRNELGLMGTPAPAPAPAPEPAPAPTSQTGGTRRKYRKKRNRKSAHRKKSNKSHKRRKTYKRRNKRKTNKKKR